VILLDTNVLSELMRAEATDPAVAAWIQAQPPDDLFTASICEAEIRYGLARLPGGHRRTQLEAAFSALLAQGFVSQVIAFDSTCAAGYATIRAQRETIGRPISQQDALIAGTALAHGAAVATRNTADFSDCGLAVIDPWRAP
jgi:toxin FitB